MLFYEEGLWSCEEYRLEMEKIQGDNHAATTSQDFYISSLQMNRNKEN